MITLPAGLRFEVVDNTNLRLDVGQKGTLQFEEFVSPTEFINETKTIFLLIDGDSCCCGIPLHQCKIIVE